jgi:hypothetical protein
MKAIDLKCFKIIFLVYNKNVFLEFINYRKFSKFSKIKICARLKKIGMNKYKASL